MFCILFKAFPILSQNPGDTCATALFLCDPNAEIKFVVGPSAKSVDRAIHRTGCVSNGSDQRWYVFGIAKTGYIEMATTVFRAGLDRNNPINELTGYDIDFALYGPFDSPDDVCGYTEADIIDCSFSGSAYPEIIGNARSYYNNSFSKSNVIAQKGKYYMLLIVNYGGQTVDCYFNATGKMLLPDSGATLQVGFSLPDIIDHQGKEAFPITIPQAVRGR